MMLDRIVITWIIDGLVFRNLLGLIYSVLDDNSKFGALRVGTAF